MSTPLSAVDRTKSAIAVAASLYAVAACIVVFFAHDSPNHWRAIPDWIALPAQVLAIAAAVAVIVGCWRTARPTATLWIIICAYGAMSLIATCVWNWWRPMGRVPSLSFADAFYLLDYALMTAAYVVAFRRLGGSFGRWETWLDTATIVGALLGTFWATLLGTFLPPGLKPHVNIPYALAYAFSLSVLMAMAVLLFLRVPRSRRAAPTLLIMAGLSVALWELGWLATWLTDRNYVGLYYNLGDVLACVFITIAAAMTPRRPEPEHDLESAEQSAYSFAPALSALMAIALFSASLATTRAPDAWILVGLIILLTLLFVTRQRAARRKLAYLHRMLSLRTADARVTELVRQSGDVFLVVDAGGHVTFASPAAEAMLGMRPTVALGRDLVALFGERHTGAVAGFFRHLVGDASPPAPIELIFEGANGAQRILKVSGANHLANPNIAGLTLTVRDISEQRRLERDILHAVNRERTTLAGSFHDGLGQELSGVAMLLHSLTSSSSLDPVQVRAQVQAIVPHMSGAVRAARELAQGLSPTYVVRGSLRDALNGLATSRDERPSVDVEVDPDLDDSILDELAADHVFRIAHEAVQNAIRHADCSYIEVQLGERAEHMELSILDDGIGYRASESSIGSIGVRFMEHRARVMGGTFAIGRRANGGTRVAVSVALRNVSRADIRRRG